MAKESKTIKCSPLEEDVNSIIELWEDFGWELMDNQRIQEFDKQVEEKGVKVDHYITFNRLTFQREKNMDRYDEVVALENKFVRINDERDGIMETKPYYRPVSSRPVYMRILVALAYLGLLLGVVIFVLNLITHNISGVVFILPSISAAVIVASFIIEFVRCKKLLKKWHENNEDRIEMLIQEMRETRRISRTIVNKKDV